MAPGSGNSVDLVATGLQNLPVTEGECELSDDAMVVAAARTGDRAAFGRLLTLGKRFVSLGTDLFTSGDLTDPGVSLTVSQSNHSFSNYPGSDEGAERPLLLGTRSGDANCRPGCGACWLVKKSGQRWKKWARRLPHSSVDD